MLQLGREDVVADGYEALEAESNDLDAGAAHQTVLYGAHERREEALGAGEELGRVGVGRAGDEFEVLDAEWLELEHFLVHERNEELESR